MKTLFSLVIGIVLQLAIPTIQAAPIKDDSQLQDTYHRAQLEFSRRNFPAALALYNDYLKSRYTQKMSDPKVIICIDKATYIYLRARQDVDAAITFLKTTAKRFAYSEEVSNYVDAWLSVAIDWKALGKLPDNIAEADTLFTLGEQYFKQGTSKKRFPRDKSGNADFHIAAVYLLPFIANHDADSRIGLALLMMGEIRRDIIHDNLYWSENFYLKEVMHRFPHSELSRRAFTSFMEDITFAYSGSAGTAIPPTMLQMLENYKKLASP